MAYLKHKGKSGDKQKPARKADAQPVNVVVAAAPDSPNGPPSHQHDINHVAGLAGIETSLDWIAKGIARLTSDEHSFSLSTAYKTDPVKITLADNDCDDTVTDLVEALQRIADSVARLAGLNRPRLERWHEQVEYTPRYRHSACDGGAPGPKEAA